LSEHLALADLERYDPHARDGGATERRFLCPRCGDGKPRDRAHRSLALNTRSGAFVCHRCGDKGLLKDFWTDEPKQTLRERRSAAVARAFALPDARGCRGAPEKREAALDPGAAWAASLPLDGTPGAVYMARRGIPADVATEAGVRYAQGFYNRPAVLFPMSDKGGALVAVNGRFVDAPRTPKTQTAGAKSLGLFTTPGALSAPLVAICEGAFDALSLWLCGIASVAIVGTSWPEWLPQALAFTPALLATDADASGDTAAAKLQASICSAARAFRLRPRGGKDWSEVLERMGATALRARLAAFAETADTGDRLTLALELIRAGRDEAAQFVVSLIDDVYMRETIRERLRRDRDMLASCDTSDACRAIMSGVSRYHAFDDELPDEIIIPASCPNTVEAIARCIDGQRRKRGAA
jgi:predicted RNA-binding Zn-ribbon protein involved in translation (DUF1610 family)